MVDCAPTPLLHMGIFRDSPIISLETYELTILIGCTIILTFIIYFPPSLFLLLFDMEAAKHVPRY